MSRLLRPNIYTRAAFFIAGDIILSLATLYMAYLLRFNFKIPDIFMDKFFIIYGILLIFKISFYYIFKLYFVSWRFFSIFELKKLFLSTTYAYSAAFLVLTFFKNFFLPFPRSVIIIDYFLTILFIGFFRISRRLYAEKFSSGKNRAILIGANEKSISLLKQDLPYTFIKIYEIEQSLTGSYLQGLKIEHIDNLTTLAKSAIITKEFSQDRLDKIFQKLKDRGYEDIKIYNPFSDKLKNISIEDLLARRPKDLDKGAIESFIKDKVILITGAGGSIGSEISKQCEKYGAKELILVDHSEYNLYQIGEQILQVPKVLVLESVVNREFLEETFKRHKPDIVIHAAAYKHVPLCEENVKEAIVNNILGTKNVIDLSIKHSVKKFILISTDKAVRPANVMGATKRVCELYAANIPSKSCDIVSVRFGNVLGSSGSVIPKFKEQIVKGGPVTVTHHEITRYFMLIPEACQLVLQAASLGKSGEIFILDMGEPVKIVDLAKKMITLSGKNIEIKFTGLRPGEKLYEELLVDESEGKTKYPSIMIGKKSIYDITLLNEKIEELLKADDQLEKLKEIVPEFEHKVNKI